MSLEDDRHADALAGEPALDPRGIDVPAGTTTRFLLLIAAVVATGSIIFMILYLAVPANRARWVDGLRGCWAREPVLGQTSSTPADVRPHTEAAARVSRCLAPTYLDQLSWAGYGLIVLFGLAVVVYWLHPWWIIRRHRLVALTAEDSPELVAYLDELSGQVGLPRPPGWMLAPYAATVSGLAFGRPPRHRVQLDAGLVTLYSTDRAAFRAVVLHELAHLRHRDVGKTYLTIAIWWAYVAVAAIPFVAVGLISLFGASMTPLNGGWAGELAMLGALLVLTALVYLTRNVILRAREVHADALAARYDGPEDALRRIVAQLSVPLPRWRALRRLPSPVLHWWTRLGTHPDPRRRLAVIDEPAILLRPSLGELAGIGITAGVLAVNIDYIFILFFTGSDLLARGLLGSLIALVLCGLLAVTLWRAAAGSPNRRPPWWAWLLPPAMLAAGFLVGQPLSLLHAYVGGATLAAGAGIGTFAVTTLLLIAGGVLMAGWTLSTSHHALTSTGFRHSSAPVVVTAASIAAAPWFAVWFTFHDLDPVFWTPTLGDVPELGADIGWYRNLARWTDVTWPVLNFLIANPLTLPGLILLWLVPITIVVRRRGERTATSPASTRLGLALITGLAGGIVVIVAGIAMAYAVKSGLSLSIRRDTTFTTSTSPFGYVQLTAYITAAVLVQAVVAAIVAARAHRHRPALIVLAVSVTGTLATIGWLGIGLFDTCVIGLFGPEARCGPSVTFADLAGYLHLIVLKGVLVAVPTALLGAALGALRRRRTTVPADTPMALRARRPWARALPAVTIMLVAAAMITATLFQLPRADDAWLGTATASADPAEGDGEPGIPTTVPTPTSTATPASTSSTSAPALVDPCVVGTWIESLGETHLAIIDRSDVTLTSKGMIERFRADGTAADEFPAGYVMAGKIVAGPRKGQTVELAISGAATFSYDTTGGTLRFDAIMANGTQTVSLNGKVVQTEALSYTSGPDHYTCQGDTMTRTSTSSGGVQTTTTHLSRISHTG